MEASHYLEMIFKSNKLAYRCNKTAFKFFLKVARARHPTSMTKVGYSYLKGTDIEYDLSLGYAYMLSVTFVEG